MMSSPFAIILLAAVLVGLVRGGACLAGSRRALLVEPRGGVELKRHRAAQAAPLSSCPREEHLDLDGDAVVWGMNHKTSSAEECCQSCKDFAPRPGGNPCKMWVWCGDPSGECWSMDIWNHTTGECWLKYQAGWDGIADFGGGSNIKINQRGVFSDAFRREHKTAPLMVPWTAGVLLP